MSGAPHDASERRQLYYRLSHRESWHAVSLFTTSRNLTDLLQLGYLIMIDFIEIVCLCGQPRAWPLSALPMLIAGDSIGVLMLVCSRDWYGFWYWHGPYYSLSREIGIWLFIALPWVKSRVRDRNLD